MRRDGLRSGGLSVELSPSVSFKVIFSGMGNGTKRSKGITLPPLTASKTSNKIIDCEIIILPAKSIDNAPHFKTMNLVLLLQSNSLSYPLSITLLWVRMWVEAKNGAREIPAPLLLS